MVSDQAADNLIGRVIGGGRYRIVSIVGRGGMATVYTAEQLNVPRQVAIKVADPEISQQPEFVERFHREVAATDRLGYEPHILPVYDTGQETGLLYMVMPLVSGGSLRELMQQKAGQPWPPEQALEVSSQALAALGYAHERGFIHRDVKPSNILFEGKRVYLADFGIAKAIEESGGKSIVQTITGFALIGTPAYMAPEQVLGKAVDQRTDLYAFGVVLYEMLTGRVPYGGDTPLQVAFKHVQGPLPPPRDANPDLPAAVEEVVLKALAKDPEARFGSAAEFANALTAAVGQTATVDERDRTEPLRDDYTQATVISARRTKAPSSRIRGLVTRRRVIIAGAVVLAAAAADRLLLRRWPWEVDLLPSMSAPRSFFTATNMPDGTLLVVAGQSDNATYLATAERYDPALNVWSPASQLRTPRFGHTATLLTAGQVLITGGQLAGNPARFTAETERYDAGTNTWTQMG
ncbi:MAG TPA: protein kinase, partial [Chloroflexota bacterium]|nr:protein kinase [Chloroflexota bacterium]